MNTSFMRLGAFLGCGTACEQINVSASAIGTKGGFFDLILNMDDTSSMEGSRIRRAKEGATTLVDAAIPAGGSSSDRVGMVPFRGCYNSDGDEHCIDSGDFPGEGDIVPLTDNNSDLVNGIDALDAEGQSGTNVCEALRMARQRLFESGVARPEAEKFIVLLTDAESNPTTSEPVSSDCNAGAANQLDQQTFDKATDIKTGQNVGGTGQNLGQTVETFVIYYGSGSDDDTPPPCNPDKIGSTDDDRNLALCIASSPTHYFPAPTANDIEETFEAIVGRLPLRLAA